MVDVYKGRIFAISGNIVSVKADAIVNAANSSLLGGSGVDGAIHKTGGSAILEECREIRRSRYPDGLPTGQAVVTTAGDMKASYVIHTVGPVWHGGSKNEAELLKQCYLNSLNIAKKKAVKTIVFPAVSTGVYAYPKNLAAQISLKSVISFIDENEYPEKVFMVFFRKSDMDIFLEVINNK